MTLCELNPERNAKDLARPILDVLVEKDRTRSMRLAVDRLSLRAAEVVANSRDALRREWARSNTKELFAIRDPFGALLSPSGADVLAELIATLPSSRTLAIVTRTPLPPALQQLMERETLAAIGPAELALGQKTALALAERSGLSPSMAGAIYETTRGWPMATLLMIDLESRAPDPLLLAESATIPRESLLSFLVHRTIARLKGLLREAVAVTALRPGLTHPELVRILGDDVDDVLWAQLSALMFVEPDAGGVRVHPEVVRLLRVRFASLMKSSYERVLHVLTGEGEYIEAARLALEVDDVESAAAIIDAAPSYMAAPIRVYEYERIIDRLDRSLITRYPNLWIATIPFRNFAVDRKSFIREAETVYYCMPPGATPDQRAAITLILASAYANAGRSEESDLLIEESLGGFARDSASARATILNFVASMRGIEGRFRDARALAAEAAVLASDDFGQNMTLQYIDAHEATYRGKTERIVIIFDELIRRQQRDEMPLYLALTACNAAFHTWANGDDADFARYVEILEDALTPGIERGFASLVDNARGRQTQVDEQFPFPVARAIAHLFRLGTAPDDMTALDAARCAARAADLRRDPYVQILAHVALYLLDRESRQVEADALRTIVAPMEAPELQDAVEGILRGGRGGILAPFVKQRVQRERHPSQAKLVVELLAGRVMVDGAPVRLSDKEFELVALLASTAGPCSRNRIGEALWEHLDPEEWSNNLKVTLSRLRAKLGIRDAVIVSNSAYRLSPLFEIDLRRLESLVRQCESGALDPVVRTIASAALAAYRGGAIAKYERYPWMHGLVARIAEMVCALGTMLAADALRDGRLDDALLLTREIQEVDEYYEPAWETAIRIHRARGDLDAARREFRRYATALANELGATPSLRLAELVRAAE